MKVSVIIPTYNEASVIEDCLKSLEKQTYPDFEVIVVDDGSNDNTSQKLQGSKIQNLKILNQDHEGPGAARNFGAKHAKGEILVFVDADMTFDRNFLKMLVKPIISGKTNGTFSSDEIVANWDNIWARCWNINEGWLPKKRHPKNYPTHQSVFRAIKKSEFVRVGGFTPGGYDDDWSLSVKLGYEAVSAPHAIFFHKNPESLGEVYKHAQWVGKRGYKYGWIGQIVALVRASLPASLLIGLVKGLMSFELRFVIFKVVYDFGVLVGIVKYIVNKKGYK
jgi:biofilm PGA synthesis N-glycosyltransferase PgaC